jgi:hypothetical protein
MIANPNSDFKELLNPAVSRKYCEVLKKLSHKQRKISCAGLFYLLKPLSTHKRGSCSG